MNPSRLTSCIILAALAAVLVAGSAQADPTHPTDFVDSTLAVTDGLYTDVAVAGVDTYYASTVNQTGLYVMATTDAGATWNVTQVNATTAVEWSEPNRTRQQFGYSRIAYNGGRIWTGYYTGTTSLTNCYSDDQAGSWTCNVLTLSDTDGRSFDIHMTSTTSWELAAFHYDFGGSSASDLWKYTTSNSGTSWTPTNVGTIAAAHTEQVTFEQHYDSGGDLIGCFAAVTSGAGQSTSFFWRNLAGTSNIPTFNIGVFNDEQNKAVGCNTGPSGEAFIGWCTVQTSSCQVDVIPDLDAGAVGSFPAHHAIANISEANNDINYLGLSGYGTDGTATLALLLDLNTDCAFYFYTTNNDLFANEDLTANAGGGDCTVAAFVDTVSSTNPRHVFTYDANLTYSPVWYTPLTYDINVSHNAIISIDNDWQGDVNGYLYAYDSLAGEIRQYTQSLGFVQSRDPCDGVEGYDMKIVGAGNLAVAFNGEIYTTCTDGSGVKFVHTNANQLSQGATTSPGYKTTDSGPFCEIVILTSDLGSAFDCSGASNWFCDPLLAPTQDALTQCSGITSGTIPDVYQPDWGTNVSSNDGWAFTGVTNGVLWIRGNNNLGTGFRVFETFEDKTYTAGTVCGTVTWGASAGSLTRWTWDNNEYFGSNINQVEVPVSQTFTRIQPTRDCQYLIAQQSTRLYVLNYTTGDILARTQTYGEANGTGSQAWTDWSVDAANNYLYASAVAPSWPDAIYRFQLYNFTASLSGTGVAGMPNPEVVTTPWGSIDTLSEQTGEADPRPLTSGGATPLTPAGGAGTIFGDPEDLDPLFGQAGSGSIFIGMIIIFVVAAGVYRGTGSGGLSIAAAMLGMAFAVTLGFLPPWIPVVLVMLGTALVVFRVRGNMGGM